MSSDWYKRVVNDKLRVNKEYWSDKRSSKSRIETGDKMSKTMDSEIIRMVFYSYP